jgi:formate hydrogenlyase transcriptional activator
MKIGDLPLELQAKLLRVLQEGTFERLGGNKRITINVRIIAATNHDLKEMVKKGLFRKDLFYRINVFPITVPPLRERRDDIPLLVWAFINEFNKMMGKAISKISEPDMNTLKNCAWPGNVRELRNIVERSMILSSGDTLTLKKSMSATVLEEDDTYPAGVSLADVEKQHIIKTLTQTGWRVSGKKRRRDAAWPEAHHPGSPHEKTWDFTPCLTSPTFLPYPMFIGNFPIYWALRPHATLSPHHCL